MLPMQRVSRGYLLPRQYVGPVHQEAGLFVINETSLSPSSLDVMGDGKIAALFRNESYGSPLYICGATRKN